MMSLGGVPWWLGVVFMTTPTAAAALPDVLVLPLVPRPATLTQPAARLRQTLETQVRQVRGIHSYAVAEDNVNVHATQAYSAMACTSVECAADLAREVGMDEVVLSTLTEHGSACGLTMMRVRARTGAVIRSARRLTVAGRCQEFQPLISAMVRELFPEAASGPTPVVVALSRPVAKPAAEVVTPTAAEPVPREHPSWLVPPALGAGLALSGVLALGAGPFLISTVGMWVGMFYLLQVLHGSQQAWHLRTQQDRTMVQAAVTLTLLWPALTAAPLALVAPGASLLTGFVSWWLPRFLWARRTLPPWVAVVGGAAPVVLASGGLVLSMVGSLLALGSYAAPWATASVEEFRPYAPLFIIMAGLGMAAGMVLSVVGAGVGALTVAGSALTCLPASVALALGADRRPLYGADEDEPLPFDALVKEADRPGRR